jgi:hypothetical protein
MNNGPFGLPPKVFSFGVLIVWLMVIPALSMVLTRNKRRRMRTAGAARLRAQQLPGAQPFSDLVGLWHFKSAGRWPGVICGVVLGFGVISVPLSKFMLPPAVYASADKKELLLTALISGAIGIPLIAYSLWRPTRAVQHCSLDPNCFLTFGRHGLGYPLDLRHYRYARTHISRGRYGSAWPSMLVLDRDSPPGIGTLLSSMLFPRVDERRIVLFHNRWWTDAGALIGPNELDDFFIYTCMRAGYPPRFRQRWFSSGRPAWDARAQ